MQWQETLVWWLLLFINCQITVLRIGLTNITIWLTVGLFSRLNRKANSIDSTHFLDFRYSVWSTKICCNVDIGEKDAMEWLPSSSRNSTKFQSDAKKTSNININSQQTWTKRSEPDWRKEFKIGFDIFDCENNKGILNRNQMCFNSSSYQAVSIDQKKWNWLLVHSRRNFSWIYMNLRTAFYSFVEIENDLAIS